VSLYDDYVSGLSPAPIYWFPSANSTGGVNYLSILGGSGFDPNHGNIFNVYATSNLYYGTYLLSGSGSRSFDVVNVGGQGSASTLDGIRGQLTVSSQTSQTALNIDDQGSSSDETYTVTSTNLSRSGAALIIYDPVTSLTINAGSANNTFTIVNTAPGTPITFNGGAGTNTLVGPDIASTFNITSLNTGNVGNVTFNSVQNLIGGASNDTFAFQTGSSLAGSIDGGGGVNTLDYSAYVGDIIVDISLSMATATNGGISRIQNVNGSIGNDLIVGDANANVLIGGTSRNIIIGGGGPDQITGSGGDNILIGGTTLWDADLPALLAIMQEWSNTSLSFDQRVNDLRQGIVVGFFVYSLNRSSVFADSSPDSLIGGGGQNWFFADSDDVIDNGAGPGPNDRLTRV
jgi:hypothetical protein